MIKLFGNVGVSTCGFCTHKLVSCPSDFPHFSPIKNLCFTLKMYADDPSKAAGVCSSWCTNEATSILPNCGDVKLKICKHSNVQGFAHKRPIAKKFDHSQQIGVGCWDERFFAVKSNGGKLGLGIDYLTCINGEWIDSHGGKGLTNFVCAACVAVTKSSYIPYDSRNKQELYFLSRMNHEFWIKGRDPFGMKRDANFMKNAADAFWVQPVQDEFRLQSVDVPGTCVQTRAVTLNRLQAELVLNWLHPESICSIFHEICIALHAKRISALYPELMVHSS
jgi:hypothetical protein